MMDILRNFTPHPIRVLSPDGSLVREIPSEGIARAEEVRGDIDALDLGGEAIPVATVKMGGLTGCPDPVDGTILIVSRPTAAAAPHRRDLIVPDHLVRDANGRIIGCGGFASLAGGLPETGPAAEPVRRDPDPEPQIDPDHPGLVVDGYDRYTTSPSTVAGGVEIGAKSRATGDSSRFLPREKWPDVVVLWRSYNSRTPAEIDGDGVVWSYADGHGMELVAVIRRGTTFTLWMPGHHGHGSGRRTMGTVLPSGAIRWESLPSARSL